MALHELLNEALITGRLERPNIASFHAVRVDVEDRPALVMRAVEGRAHQREIQKDPRSMFYTTGQSSDATDAPSELGATIFVASRLA